MLLGCSVKQSFESYVQEEQVTSLKGICVEILWQERARNSIHTNEHFLKMLLFGANCLLAHELAHKDS